METIVELLKIVGMMLGLFGLFMLTWGFIERGRHYSATWSIIVGVIFLGVMLAWI